MWCDLPEAEFNASRAKWIAVLREYRGPYESPNAGEPVLLDGEGRAVVGHAAAAARAAAAAEAAGLGSN
jgi:hypothetical protein